MAYCLVVLNSALKLKRDKLFKHKKRQEQDKKEAYFDDNTRQLSDNPKTISRQHPGLG
jgi:hypothetical protein